MYVKVKDGAVVAFPHGLSFLRQENPDTSFPDQMPDERLADWGVFPVVPRDIPQPFDPVDQNAVRKNPTLIKGKWYETWGVTAATAEEVAQRLSDLAQNARATRNELLAQSDWTQLPDAPVDRFIWASYRAQLRDISGQEGFPRTIVWPTI